MKNHESKNRKEPSTAGARQSAGQVPGKQAPEKSDTGLAEGNVRDTPGTTEKAPAERRDQ